MRLTGNAVGIVAHVTKLGFVQRMNLLYIKAIRSFL
jgi:hypothetical protein